ncbi:hypothetical protein [Nocardiopsis potens]|uniref:hypothetical protein n=1 Tax=Nocardiopsis potens TaxID=1246458 RepID=UPI00034B8CDD|nr:hypothetical protein [Nocardiopsis potens]
MRSRDRWEDPRISVTCPRSIGPAGAAHIADRLAGLERCAGPPVLRVHAEAGYREVGGYGRLLKVEAVAVLEGDAVHAGAEADSLYAAVDKLYRRLCLRLASPCSGDGPGGGRPPGPARKERGGTLPDGPR